MVTSIEAVQPVGLEVALSASKWLSDEIIGRLSERAEVVFRDRLALAQFSLALDHREAVLLLVMCGANPSAMALARPVVEAFVRGLWAESIASDEQLLDFMKLGKGPGLASVEKALKNSNNSMAPLLGAMKAHFDTLHDYVHGGARQISRWLHEGSIEPKYAPAQMVELLRLVDLMGCLAAAGRERRSARDDGPLMVLAGEVLAKTYYGRAPAAGNSTLA